MTICSGWIICLANWFIDNKTSLRKVYNIESKSVSKVGEKQFRTLQRNLTSEENDAASLPATT
jgi:hypothetical protein